MGIIFRYAVFRHKNQAIGRALELLFIVLLFGSIATLLLVTDTRLIVAAIINVLICTASFWFFMHAEKLRHGIIDDQLK